MFVYTILFAGAASLAALVILTRRTAARRGSSRLVICAFVLGFASAFPAYVLERFLLPYTWGMTGMAGDALRAFCLAGAVEEGVKILALRFLSTRREFRRVSDGMVTAVAAGLGFAFLENIFFTLENPWVLILRSVTSVPLHAAAAALSGYCVGLTRFTYKPLLLRGFCLAALLHGAYNFFLMRGSWYGFISMALLLAALYLVLRFFRAARTLDIRDGRITRNRPED
jgi:RsiW-degrading membrane proteinase PrsW (M82 family)